MNEKELKEIQGGAFSLTGGLIFGAIITFFIGVIDGYIRPLACR